MMQTEKDVAEQVQKVIEKMLPDILRNSNNTVRDAIVSTIDINSKTLTAQVTGTSEIVSNIKYISAITTPVAGMNCLILSSDPKLRARCYALIFT